LLHSGQFLVDYYQGSGDQDADLQDGDKTEALQFLAEVRRGKTLGCLEAPFAVSFNFAKVISVQ